MGSVWRLALSPGEGPVDAVDTRLVASYAVAIAFDVLMPVGVLLWARRRLGVAWKVVGWGAAAFALSQLLTRVPLVQVAQYFMRDALKTSPVVLGVWIAVLSLTAGLFEETERLWVFRKPLKDFRRWRDAVGFGVGNAGGGGGGRSLRDGGRAGGPVGHPLLSPRRGAARRGGVRLKRPALSGPGSGPWPPRARRCWPARWRSARCRAP